MTSSPVPALPPCEGCVLWTATGDEASLALAEDARDKLGEGCETILLVTEKGFKAEKDRDRANQWSIKHGKGLGHQVILVRI